MFININQAAEEPIYLQIRSEIIRAIAQGDLLPGNRLPAVRQLAADLGINLHTVNKAYAVLRDEGYVTMKSRTGAIVAAHPPAATGSTELSAAESERLAANLGKLLAEHKAAGRSAESFAELVMRGMEAAYGTAATAEAFAAARHTDAAVAAALAPAPFEPACSPLE